MTGAEIVVVLNLASSAMALFQKSSDGGLMSLLRYQSDISDLMLNKLDDLALSVLSLRTDLQKVVEHIDETIEDSRLQQYFDELQASNRSFQLAMATLRASYSTESERTKARDDLDEAFRAAIASSAKLRAYSGLVPALAIRPSIVLICALISQTNRGAAALRSELADHRQWALDILNPNNPRSLVGQLASAKSALLDARKSLVEVHQIDVDNISKQKNLPRSEFIRLYKLEAIVPEKEWTETYKTGSFHGEGDGPQIVEVNHFRPKTWLASMQLTVWLDAAAHQPSRVPQLTLTFRENRGDEILATESLHLEEGTTPGHAEAIIKNNPTYVATRRNWSDLPALAERLSGSRARHKLYQVTEMDVQATQRTINELLSFL